MITKIKQHFLVPASLALLTVVACQAAKVAGPGQPSSPNASGSGGAGASPGTNPSLPTNNPPLFDAATGGSADVAPPPANATCAEDSQKAKQVPVTLVMVVDASSSMLANAGASSKYAQVKQALEQFVAAPGSSGLGIGLGFFPQPGSGSSCQSDVDCGYMNAPTPPPCQLTSVCAKSVTADGVARLCGGGRNGACPAGDECVPLGRCAMTLDDCTNVGQPCPGGAAGDTCTAVGKTCEFTDDQTCDTAAYENLAVPIVSVPSPGQRLVARAFARRGPSGGTPMRPALEGALTTLRKYLAAHPEQKAALVLATDGAPFGCARNTAGDVATVLQGAHMGAPSISTYVIGVATPNDVAERVVLGQLATAGGTTTPFVISATENLSQRFLETLSQIRGQALPCEFAIPKPNNNGSIDFSKVNLSVRGPAATEEVLYTGSAARCDATRGGWYYDVDPTTGGSPTRVVVCEATCRKLKMQADATVDIRFGCQTRTID